MLKNNNHETIYLNEHQAKFSGLGLSWSSVWKDITDAFSKIGKETDRIMHQIDDYKWEIAAVSAVAYGGYSIYMSYSAATALSAAALSSGASEAATLATMQGLNAMAGVGGGAVSTTAVASAMSALGVDVLASGSVLTVAGTAKALSVVETAKKAKEIVDKMKNIATSAVSPAVVYEEPKQLKSSFPPELLLFAAAYFLMK